jgi:riboflavin synthase
MSKLTKLITKPNLFFKDAKAKRATKKNANNILSKPKKNIKNPKGLLKRFNTLDDIRVILHTGESCNTGIAHLKDWIAILMRNDVKFLVLVRNLDLFTWLRDNYPWVYISYAKSPNDVACILNKMPYANTILYTSSTGNNVHLVKFNHLKHVFIGYGNGDAYSNPTKDFRLYDEIWVAGDAHIDNFRNSDFNAQHLVLKKIGSPKIKKILEESQTNWKERNCHVLYLPAWEGCSENSNYSSALISGGIIQTIANNLKLHIDVKFHLDTGTRISELKKIEANLTQCSPDEEHRLTIIPRTVPVDTISSAYNIFICDISSDISECLYGNGPIFVYIPKDKTLPHSNSNMAYINYCYTFSTLDELEDKIRTVLDGKDYLEEKRRIAVDYTFGYQQTLENTFIKEIKNIYKQPQQINYVNE